MSMFDQMRAELDARKGPAESAAEIAAKLSAMPARNIVPDAREIAQAEEARNASRAESSEQEYERRREFYGRHGANAEYIRR
jgi:hypothetical protein